MCIMLSYSVSIVLYVVRFSVVTLSYSVNFVTLFISITYLKIYIFFSLEVEGCYKVQCYKSGLKLYKSGLLRDHRIALYKRDLLLL